MIYSNSFPELEKFIQNPICNIEFITERFQRPSIITRILLKIPFLRRFIGHEEALRVFEKTILSLSDDMAKDLASLSVSNIVHEQEYFAECFSEFTKKVSMEISEECGVEQDEEVLIRSHFFTHSMEKMEYHCNRIFEVINSPSNDVKKLLKIDNVWEYFYLSEMYFLIINGYMKIESKKDGFHITRNNNEKELLTYWMSEVLEFHSKFSYKSMLQQFLDDFKGKDKVENRMLDFLVDATLDKFYSINVKYLSSEVKVLKKYKLLRSTIALFLLVELRVKSHGYAEKTWIYRQNFIPHEDIEYIEDKLSTLTSYKYGEHSNFIYLKDNFFKRGSLGERYGLRKFSSKLLDKYPKEGRDLGDRVGDSFEKDCIFKYLKKLRLKNYDFYEGIVSTHNNSEKYDADLIIKDISRNHYYFVQVKHLMFDSPVYLHEQVRTLYGEKCHKAINVQLESLNKNLDTDSVQKKLKGKGIVDVSEKNSSFIFLHNLPHLDFYIHNGIYCYEWNTFRNIINEGKFYLIRNELTEEIKLN